jgi:outer membrane lipopolysaccharide assembly protein LptE/RlpB
MSKVVMMIALLVGLSACHAGFGLGDNGQSPIHVATNAWQSAVAQGSVGTMLPAAD